MSDDFNTSLAIGELNKFVKASNQALSKSSTVKPEEFYNKAHQIRVIGKVLGLFEESPESFIKKHNEELLKELGLTEKEIKKKIEERQEARENKNWALSDEIRDELLGKGILLKDSQEETTWVLSDRL
jgi:cysteinyl-tRNA synthetase